MVLIEIGAGETILTLAEAAAAAKVHVDTVKKWMVVGCHGDKLEGGRIGNEYRTTREALQRFMAKRSGVDPGRPAPISAGPRSIAHELARAQALAMGVNVK
jgi:hypothetical protein